jgi:predicted MFS family arabinose efflux permease
LSSGIWGGISAGPLVGQWLGTFERAAAMQMITALIAFAVLMRVPEDYRPEAHSGRRPWIPSSLIAPGIAIGFVNVHYPVVVGFLILHLARHGNSGPAAFSAYAGVILLSRFFLGGLPDRIPARITYNFGLAAMATALIVIALAPPPVAAIGAGALLGFGFSFPWSSVAATVLKRTPERERGSTVGILSAFYDLFVGLSSFAAGAVSNRFGYPASFAMAAAAVGAAGIAGLFVFGDRSTDPLTVETGEQAVLR